MSWFPFQVPKAAKEDCMRALRHCSILHGREKQEASRDAMLSASSSESRRKLSADSIYRFNPDCDLAEALDATGKPVCLLPKQELINQNLPCHGVAILAFAREDILLLSISPESIFNVTCHDLVTAGFSASSFAQWLFEKETGLAGTLKFAFFLPSAKILYSIYMARLSCAMLHAREDNSFIVSYLPEIPALKKLGLADPLLDAVYSRFMNLRGAS